MKCPKCHYLGFDTGDRCRHCGYNFALIESGARDDADLALHDGDEANNEAAVDLPLNDRQVTTPSDLSTHRSDALELSLRHDAGADDGVTPVSRHPPAPADGVSLRPVSESADASDRGAALRTNAAARSSERPLPLFPGSPDDEDDRPLVRLPAAPRAPLSVRRTPDAPRLRAVPKVGVAPARLAEPELTFTDESLDSEDPRVGRAAPGVVRPPVLSARSNRIAPVEGSGIRRAIAALLDHGILLAIDVTVAYFTLRMAGLDVDDWALLPRVPLVVFLLMLKIAYFAAFTSMGGQTIGKMAVHIRVVSDAYRDVGAAQSMQRTLAGMLSALTLGIGFLPALAGDHRALHDRLARTRVVSVASA